MQHVILQYNPLLGKKDGGKINILPVVHISITLRDLSGEVDDVAAEEEVVLGRDGEGVAGESGGVDNQGAGHFGGDAGFEESRC